MKLISMTDYVLEQINTNQFDEDFTSKVVNYAKFLKQPLTFGMFVPVDFDGNVLEKPKCDCICEFDREGCPDECWMYINAKNCVLFDGFEIKAFLNDVLRIIDKNNFEIRYNVNTKFIFCSYPDSIQGKIEIIEDLVKYNLTLTESAIKNYRL